jgi:hypothetical protein
MPASVPGAGQFRALADPPKLLLLSVLGAEGLSVLALVEGPGDALGSGLPGDALGLELPGDALGLGVLGGKLGLELLGDGLGLGLLGGELGVGLLGDGLGLLGGGLVLLGGGLVLLGGGLGLGLLAGLELVAVGPVDKVAHAVELGLAVVVALVARLVGVAARPGCCAAQLAEPGCW